MNRSTAFAAILAVFLMALCVTGTGIPANNANNDINQTLSVREAKMEKVPGQFDPAEYKELQLMKFDWLTAEAVPLHMESILSIHLSEKELAEIDNYSCEECNQNSRQKLRVGMFKNVGAEVSFKGIKAKDISAKESFRSHGMMRATNDGGYVWTTAAESNNAVALRLHFTDFSLPNGTSLFIYNENGEAFGPYSGKGPNLNGEFWSHTVSGSKVFIQVRHTGKVQNKTLKKTRFVVQDIAHMGKQFLLPFTQNPSAFQGMIEAFCSFNATCVVDAMCYGTGTWGAIEDVRDAVAHLQFVSGAYVYICSGGLMNDTVTTSQIPYFLTANHCISTSSEASSLEAYWQFWTSSCGGACYDPVGAVPRTLGSEIMATNSTSDFTLLRLSQTPPSGSVLLGWTTATVATTNNYELYRLSHPKGAPQAFSKHRVDTSAGTCGSWPRGNWIYSRDLIGATEGGSSGSVVCNAGGQVVGQLSGACGYNVNDPCDSTSNATVDGAFAAYFSQVSPYLDPGTTPTDEMHVSNIYVYKSGWWIFSYANAEVTILDESNNPVSGATVYGTFSGDASGSTSAVTNSSGVAALSLFKFGSISSFTFCVTNVTHSSYTYNSSDNVETCDTY